MRGKRTPPDEGDRNTGKKKRDVSELLEQKKIDCVRGVEDTQNVQ